MGSHDEDSDLLADNCDNCPADANADQNDLDGDGVGDVCDPDPNVGGDVLAFFDSFSSNALSPLWTIEQGTWNVTGDVVTQPDFGQGRMSLDVALRNVTVRAGATVLAVLETGGVENALIGARYTIDDTAHVCSSRNSNPDTVAIFEMAMSSFVSPAATVNAPAQITNGARFVIELAAAEASIRCSVDDTVVAHTDARLTNGRVFVGSDDMQVAFDHVVVYTLDGEI